MMNFQVEPCQAMTPRKATNCVYPGQATRYSSPSHAMQARLYPAAVELYQVARPSEEPVMKMRAMVFFVVSMLIGVTGSGRSDRCSNSQDDLSVELGQIGFVTRADCGDKALNPLVTNLGGCEVIMAKSKAQFSHLNPSREIPIALGRPNPDKLCLERNF